MASAHVDRHLHRWVAWCVTQGGSCAIAEADQGDVLAVAEVKNA